LAGAFVERIDFKISILSGTIVDLQQFTEEQPVMVGSGMHDIVVRVFSRNGHELLAMIPLNSMAFVRQDGIPGSDSEIIAGAMLLLRDQRRFSDAEIESFRYRVEHPRRPDVSAFNADGA
jgi:hypothetical protein